ncbi:MAG TPA: hypothetical protein VGR47_19610 [Terracidiphilus sp.]|nr:hypothetical protein [Terracidiphilus sp.]
MPYQISKGELDSLGAALAAYYEEAWQQGIRGLFDNMAQSQMGIVTKYIDQAKDTYANLRKTSGDAFGVTLKADLKKYVTVYVANRSDIASLLVTAAETGLKALASHIPVPVLGTVVSQVVGFAATKGREELHERSILEADKQLSAKTGAETAKLPTTDAEAATLSQNTMEQYKLICKYIQTMPANITTFEDAVTFPGAVFKLQKAASGISRDLDSMRRYMAGMQDRLLQVQKVSADYIDTVRKKMPDAVNSVLQSGYGEAYKNGEADIAKNKYSAPPSPVMKRADKPGGATQLAAYLAHAVAQGYYDAGNRGPQVMAKMAAPVPPPRPPRPFPPPIPPRR